MSVSRAILIALAVAALFVAVIAIRAGYPLAGICFAVAAFALGVLVFA